VINGKKKPLKTNNGRNGIMNKQARVIQRMVFCI
jgi:hypothetical protein